MYNVRTFVAHGKNIYTYSSYIGYHDLYM